MSFVGMVQIWYRPSHRKSLYIHPHILPLIVLHRYFLDQNDAIANGSASGVKINVKNVGIGGPYMVSSQTASCTALGQFLTPPLIQDPLNQLPRYLDYVVNSGYVCSALLGSLSLIEIL